MSLILSLGSNLGNRHNYLKEGRKELAKIFREVMASKILKSKAVDYINQPDFLNQVIEYHKPQMAAKDILIKILSIEKQLGRTRTIHKGPRTLDIDIIFLGQEQITSQQLCIPHPQWKKRPFIFASLQELPGFQVIKNFFQQIDDASTPHPSTPTKEDP